MNTSRANAKPAHKPTLCRNLLELMVPELVHEFPTARIFIGFYWRRCRDFIDGAPATETAHYPKVAQKVFGLLSTTRSDRDDENFRGI